MTLRRRIGMVAAVAVAFAVVICAIVCYMVVRSQLLDQVNSELQQQAGLIRLLPDCNGSYVSGRPGSANGPAPIWQVTTANGAVACGSGNFQLPVTDQVLAIAGGPPNASHLQDLTLGGTPVRELTVHVGLQFGFDGPVVPAAMQLARPLDGVKNILRDLRFVLLLVCAGGIALAAVLGRLAARQVLAPLAEVAQTARHIEETEDLSSRIRVHADDEVGQLATRFNAMIERLQHSRDALDESVSAQRQLVADASHELRTPITSLRTNIEVLLE